MEPEPLMLELLPSLRMLLGPEEGTMVAAVLGRSPRYGESFAMLLLGRGIAVGR